jgi:hypothetical protein
VCRGERADFLPAARGPRQLQRVMARLNGVAAGGLLPGGDTLRASLHFSRAPGVVCVASDFLDWPSALSHALLRLRRMRHDVRALCLHTQAEIDAAFDTAPAYRDPEQGGAIHRFEREVYAHNRAAHFDAVAGECRRNDVPLQQACIEQAPGGVLRAWLRVHSAGARAA